MTAREPEPCATCGGVGGHVGITVDDGIIEVCPEARRS